MQITKEEVIEVLEKVKAYIKFTIKERYSNDFIIFISFHKANWPIQYKFKKS